MSYQGRGVGSKVQKCCMFNRFCDYVHRRSPGGRQRDWCAARDPSDRGPAVAGGRRGASPPRSLRLARRYLRRRCCRRHYSDRRRTETMRAYLSVTKQFQLATTLAKSYYVAIYFQK